jgi:hypothetical protein
MDKHIYDKTDKGRDEIATRKYHVPAKLRSLLVMIDGHRPLGVLMTNFGALGLTVDHVAELLRDEYIFLADEGLPEPVPEAERAKAHGPSARARMAARRESSARAQSHDDVVHAAAGEPSAATAAAMAGPISVAGTGNMTDAERQVAVHEFYTQTIKSTLGLRGMMLQLKVERCASLDDLRELRDVYLEAVLKAKGREMALSLSGRLDQLLGVEHSEKALS